MFQDSKKNSEEISKGGILYRFVAKVELSRDSLVGKCVYIINQRTVS